MAKQETTKIDSLEALLGEKRKHETYLAKLEERREQVPAHVFNKLRDEYLTKLTDLQVQASLEAESLTESLRVNETAVAEVEQRLATATEQRIEGELRAAVGEFDEAAWEKKKVALDASIAQLENEKQVKVAAFERTRSLLTEARGAAAALSEPPAPVEEPSSEPSAPPAAAPAGRASAPAGVPPVPPTRASAPAGVPPVPTPVPPVPAARATPAGIPVPPSPAPPPPRSSTPPVPQAPSAAPIVEAPSAPKPAAPMVGSPSFDELAFLNSVVGRASSSQRQEEPPAPPAPPAAPPEPRPSSGARSMASEPAGPLGRPTPRTSQAIKTLKCQECGTLNYPTEWYCERCGGELAAL